MTLTKNQLDIYKALLLKEKAKIELELGTVGELDPHTPGDWIPKVPEYEDSQSDPNDVADKIEEMGERVGIEATLEIRLEKVKEALTAIEDGTYGTCNVGGNAHDIPEGRLKANPASTTCVAHAD